MTWMHLSSTKPVQRDDNDTASQLSMLSQSASIVPPLNDPEAFDDVPRAGDAGDLAFGGMPPPAPPSTIAGCNPNRM